MANDQAKSSAASDTDLSASGDPACPAEAKSNAKKSRKDSAKSQRSKELPPPPPGSTNQGAHSDAPLPTGVTAALGAPALKPQPNLAAMSNPPLPFPRAPAPGGPRMPSGAPVPPPLPHTSSGMPPPMQQRPAQGLASQPSIEPPGTMPDRPMPATSPLIGSHASASAQRSGQAPTRQSAAYGKSLNAALAAAMPGPTSEKPTTNEPIAKPDASAGPPDTSNAKYDAAVANVRDAAAMGAQRASANSTHASTAEDLIRNQDASSDTSFVDDEMAAPERRIARRRPAGPVRGKIAANDDVPSIGGLIYALEQKPSNRIYEHATYASIGWAVIALIFAYITLSSEAALSSWGTILTRPTTFLTAAAVIVPVAIIWFLALLSWRAEELRLRSSTMTEVAIRLAEPDRMAEDSIASLGQAVRRQVGFMNDAIGRALGRAGELEALVHNEVAALERSYEENERRIRGLINELANERHALNSTSTSFNETLRTLGREVPILIERLSNQQTNLTQIIHGAGDNLQQLESSLAKSVASLSTELGGRTGEIKGVLENYTGALGSALGQRTDDMQKMLEGYTGALSQALTVRTSQMQKAFTDHMSKLDSAIANRTTNLQTVFEEYARALDSTLANRAGKLDQQLVERTRALDAAFENRLKLFDQTVQTSTRAIDQAVDDRARSLTNALESHARNFSETITRQSTDLDNSLNQGISAVRRTSENITRQSLKAIENLAGQSDMLKSVSENLVSQIASLTNRFEAQGQTILKAANALESVNYKIDSTLQTRHTQLSDTLDRMVGKADEFTRHVADYSTTIEGTLSQAEQRALAAAEQLKIGAQSHRDRTINEIERLKSDTDAESARALAALKDRLAHVSQEVSNQLGSMTDRFAETSEDMRRRAERVAEDLAREQARMKEEAERLPKTTRETAEAMRLALQDQLRAIDQLSSLTAREAQRRDVALPVAHGGALKSVPVTPPPGRQAGVPTTTRETTGGNPASSRNYATLSESLSSELNRAGKPPSAGPHPTGEPGKGDSGNWSLGDLLKRASDDGATSAASGQKAPGQPPPAPHTPFKLDVDALSRAIDGATAAVIWSRLRTGQRGVMVRNIYAPDGREVFDEVTRRYPVDPSLRGTIDRYIADFERILREAEAKDASGRLAQSHMTSTMGRVYLLLAHASGRIS